MPGYDLHTHTDFSDGTTSPEDNVRAALALGLEGIGITDHDTTAPFARASDAAAGTRLDVVLGTEFSAEFEGRSVHVLGYWVDPGNEPLQRWYFTPNYDCVRVADDDLAMELVGQGVKLIGASELVAADGRQVGVAPGHGPAAQVRHLEHRQRLLAAAVAREHAARAALRMPQVDERDPVLAVESREVMAPVGRDEAVVRLFADPADARGRWPLRVRSIDDPDLPRLEQAEDEAVARRVGDADDLRSGRHLRQELERAGVEDADAAR